MQTSEEKDDSPLLDSDISRLIKLSREVGYKKQDNIPQRNLVDFKPLSIEKIVAEIETKESKLDVPNKVDSEEKVQATKIETKDNETKKQEKQAEKEIGLDNDEIEEAQKQDVTEKKDEKSNDEIIEPSEEVRVQNLDNKEVLEQNLTPTSNNYDAIEAAKKEGIEIGKKMAFSELEADHKKSVEALNMLIRNIKSKETIDKSELMDSIIKVITNLASERAGLEIDKTPEILKDKIVAFVNEIELASNKVTLNLNPRDAELIKELTKEPYFLENIELKENSELFRGDFILQMGTIEMGNLISKQLFTSEPKIEDATNHTIARDDRAAEEANDLNEAGDTSLDQVENQSEVVKNGK